MSFIPSPAFSAYIDKAVLPDGRLVYLADPDLRQRWGELGDIMSFEGFIYKWVDPQPSAAMTPIEHYITNPTTHQIELDTSWRPYTVRINGDKTGGSALYTDIDASVGDVVISNFYIVDGTVSNGKISGGTVVQYNTAKEFICTNSFTGTGGPRATWEEIGNPTNVKAMAFVNKGVTDPITIPVVPGTVTTTNDTVTATVTYVKPTGSGSLAKQVVTDVTTSAATISQITGVGKLPTLTLLTKDVKEVTNVTTATISIPNTLASLTTKNTSFVGVNAVSTGAAVVIDGNITPPTLTTTSTSFTGVNEVTTTTISIIDGVGSAATRAKVNVMYDLDFDPGSIPTGTDVTVVTNVSFSQAGGATTSTSAVPVAANETNTTYVAISASDSHCLVIAPLTYAKVGSNTITVVTGVTHTDPVLKVDKGTATHISSYGTLPSCTPSKKDIWEITGTGSTPTKKAQTVVTAVTTKSHTAISSIEFTAGAVPTKSLTVVTAVTTKSHTAISGATYTPETLKAQEVVTAVSTANVAVVTGADWSAGTLPTKQAVTVITAVTPTKESVGVTVGTATATLTISGTYVKTTGVNVSSSTVTVLVNPYE